MTQTVLVLGAKGRFGRAASTAFRDAGWQVRAFVRPGGAGALEGGMMAVEGDAFDPATVSAAAEGADVIVNALNPPYPAWTQDLPRITASVLAAAKASGATVLIPGNVYNYGEGMPARLAEETPHHPTAKKGRLREEMERAYQAAAADGVRTIILRGGDFIEREKTGNWFDSYIANKVHEGRVTYPGPLDQVHAWAYLPDMARAAVGLAERRAEFSPFEEFGFEGFSLTGRELTEALERATGRALKLSKMPWSAMRLMAVASPMLREVLEVEYLWRVPHAIDGAKLRRALPEFEATPLDEVMGEFLASESPAPAIPALEAV